MTRLSILIGIGLMLVGAMAYALPTVQDFTTLYSAFAGIVIATGGFVAMRHDEHRKNMMHMNAVAGVMILVWACLKVVPDSFGLKAHGTIPLIADIDTIGLSAILVYYLVKSFVEARIRKETEDRQEEEAMKILESK